MSRSEGSNSSRSTSNIRASNSNNRSSNCNNSAEATSAIATAAVTAVMQRLHQLTSYSSSSSIPLLLLVLTSPIATTASSNSTITTTTKTAAAAVVPPTPEPSPATSGVFPTAPPASATSGMSSAAPPAAAAAAAASSSSSSSMIFQATAAAAAPPLLLRTASSSSQQQELAETVAALIADVAGRALPHCTPIAISSTATGEDAAAAGGEQEPGAWPYDELVLSQLLQLDGPPWMLHTRQHVTSSSSSPPSPATLQPPGRGARVGGDGLCILYVLLMELQEAGETFRQISRSDWYPGASRYFVLYGGQPVTQEMLHSQAILTDAYNTLYISQQQQQPLLFHLYANCPFCRAGGPEVLLRNSWDREAGLHQPDALFPDLFRDCNGHRFRAVTLEFSPFMVYSRPEGAPSDGPVQRGDCLDVRIMDSIARTYNFTYDVYEPEDGKWGYQLPNGSWTGVIGTVERYEADMSMDVLITAQRDEYVDFTIGYHTEPLTFVTSKPRPMPQWLSLVRPFQGDVWAGLLVLIVASGFTLWILIKSSRGIYGKQELSLSRNFKKLPGTQTAVGVLAQRKASFTESELFNGPQVARAEGGRYLRVDATLSEAYFIMFGSFFSQSQRWVRDPSSLLYSACWILSSLVMTISYTSTLTALLTVPALSPTLDTLEDLVKSDFSWGIADYGAADYQLFKTSEVPIYQEIYRGLDFCPSLLECIKQTQREQFAYISWRTYMRDAIASELTDVHGDSNIHMARQDFFPGEFGFTLQKGSPLKRPFDRVIRRLLEVGFVSKWLTEFIEQHKQEGRRKAINQAAASGTSGTDVLSDVGGSQSLSLHHLQGVFFVYVICLLMSMLVFMTELCVRKVVGSKHRYPED